MFALAGQVPAPVLAELIGIADKTATKWAALATRDDDIVRATKDAKAYLIKAIERADEMGVGSGHGPLHHFHQWW